MYIHTYLTNFERRITFLISYTNNNKHEIIRRDRKYKSMFNIKLTFLLFEKKHCEMILHTKTNVIPKKKHRITLWETI